MIETNLRRMASPVHKFQKYPFRYDLRVLQVNH